MIYFRTNRQARLDLTNAQLIALNSAPQVLAPRPGANRMLFFRAGTLLWESSFGSYGNFGEGGFEVRLGPDLVVGQAGLPGQGAKLHNILPVELSADRSELVNLPLMLKLANSSGDLTGGTVADYLKVTVFYDLVRL